MKNQCFCERWFFRLTCRARGFLRRGLSGDVAVGQKNRAPARQNSAKNPQKNHHRGDRNTCTTSKKTKRAEIFPSSERGSFWVPHRNFRPRLPRVSGNDCLPGGLGGSFLAYEKNCCDFIGRPWAFESKKRGRTLDGGLCQSQNLRKAVFFVCFLGSRFRGSRCLCRGNPRATGRGGRN